MRKILFMLLLVFTIAQTIQALKKTITITEYNTEASPIHVTGTTYRASDGTEITLEKGQDPTNPKYYKIDGEDHGLPTATVTHTYTITIEIPDIINQAEISNMIESEIRKELKDNHKPNETIEANLLGIVEVPVTKKFLGIIPYESTERYAITGSVHTTTVITQKKEIQQSKSVQIGDPVLMTSGQYRYDETDMTIAEGNAVLELGRHYQSGDITGDSIGEKWFHSLDTRIILGTSESTEQAFIDISNGILSLDYDLRLLKKQVELTVREYEIGIANINNEISMTEKALNDLRNSGYTSYSEVQIYITDLTNKLNIQKDVRDEIVSEKDAFLSKTTQYIAEYETKLESEKETANELRKITDHSVFNRNKNTISTQGVGFNEYTDIGTKVLIVYDTYGRKSIFELITEPTFFEGEVTFPDGAETESLSDSTDTLIIRRDGCYELTKKDGTVWIYGTDGMLRSITDRNGNSIVIEYENNKAAYIFRNEVKIANVEWKDGKISAIVNARDITDRTEYKYDKGVLSDVTDCDGDTISFGYTTDGLLNTITKPDGSIVQIDYDLTINGKRLASRTKNEEDFWETFSYSQSGKKVEYTSHSGIRTVYEYDEEMRLTKETSADGTEKTYDYDTEGNIIRETLNGNITSYEFDIYGNKIRSYFSDGSFEAWTYDSYGSVASYRDRDGIVSEYLRNAKGNVTTTKVGGKTLSNYEYNSKGQVSTAKTYRSDGTSLEQHFSYDIYGNLIERVTGNSTDQQLTEKWTYDGRNRPLSYSINGETEETYAYNGRKTTVTIRSGLVSEYLTDNRKDCVSIKETDTVTGEIRFTSIEYDKRHMPIKRKLSPGENQPVVMTAEYRYFPGGEPEGELISDGQSHIVTIYDYKDKGGRNLDYVTSIRRIRCSSEEINQMRQNVTGTNTQNGFKEADLEKLWRIASDKYSISYEYEITPNGTKITTIAPSGTQTIAEYDAWSRPVSTTDALGIKSLQEYTSAGRLKKQQSQFGGFTEYRYDEAGNLSGTGREGGKITSLTINTDGTPCRVTDRNGQTTEYFYDSLGNLVKVTNAAGSRYMTYDNNGRLILSVTGGNGSIQQAEIYTSYSYDSDNRTTIYNNGGLYPISYKMNAWNETTSITDGEGNTQTMSYDCAGRLIVKTDAYGRKTFYEYDVRGLVTKATYPDGTYNEYKYDAYGNLTETLSCGKSIWRGQYDSSGMLIKQEGELISPSSYQYDDTGRITRIMTNDETSVSYAYTDRGRTVSTTDAMGNTTVSKYDNFGNIITESNKRLKSKTYTYNDENELTSIKQFSGKNIVYNTSSDGLTHSTIFDDGSSDIVTYTLSGLVKSIQNATNKTYYEYDKGGMLVKQTDGTSDGTITFTYDKAGRRTRITGAGRNTEIFYGKNGEIIEIKDNISKTGFKIEYDTMMREILRIADNGTRRETSYYRNGNVDKIIVKNERGIVLDAKAYIYSDDGRKEAIINGDGEVTLFDYDKQGRLSAVLYQDTTSNRQRESEILAEYKITDLRYNQSESRYISKKVYEKIAELQNLCHNINRLIPTYRNFRKERFVYDKNGNRKYWYIGGGLLEYSYDADDRLVECRTGGKTVRTYDYDEDGNLVRESVPENPGLASTYQYSGNGRMTKSVSNRNGSEQETTYAYDALGRRVASGTRETGTLFTTYDGLGFEALSEARDGTAGAISVSIDSAYTNSVKAGERYRYIADDVIGSEKMLKKDDQKVAETTGFRTRTTLYINGTPAAVSMDGERMYLSCDDIGSVSLVTDDSSMLLAQIFYDAFGTPVANTGYESGADSMFGASGISHDAAVAAVLSRAAYAGKPYNAATGLYDYGFRDYSPSLARFTTVDPIR
ncbi:MAG: DUF6531 domain-containing protein, partial [Treponemataceae bacterium]|nr:DUF6531 domain-containing protein [Treponemataceae bacterium]